MTLSILGIFPLASPPDTDGPAVAPYVGPFETVSDVRRLLCEDGYYQADLPALDPATWERAVNAALDAIFAPGSEDTPFAPCLDPDSDSALDPHAVWIAININL